MDVLVLYNKQDRYTSPSIFPWPFCVFHRPENTPPARFCLHFMQTALFKPRIQKIKDILWMSFILVREAGLEPARPQ